MRLSSQVTESTRGDRRRLIRNSGRALFAAAAGQKRPPSDLEKASAHGDTVEEIAKAHELFVKAAELDPAPLSGIRLPIPNES